MKLIPGTSSFVYLYHNTNIFVLNILCYCVKEETEKKELLEGSESQSYGYGYGTKVSVGAMNMDVEQR